MGSSIVPNQWKSSVITPVPKITNPKCEADFRPISVTSILSRKLENYVVNSNLYPAMNDTHRDLIFSDQYAFRPTGSATAALIAILNDVTESLRMGKMVVMLSLDFSKAFDTVRHKSLFDKIHMLGINDTVHDWMLSYFENREHSTKFLGSLSTKKSINASVVQGSSLGPCSFSVVAADLKPQNDCFHMLKFADDMNLTTTTDNYDKIGDELYHVESWAKENNMSLNKTKTKEIIFRTSRMNQPIPQPLDGIQLVKSLKLLGVTLQDNLSMNEHVNSLLLDCSNMLYALNTLPYGHMG